MVPLPLSFLLLACDNTRRAFLKSTACVPIVLVNHPAISTAIVDDVDDYPDLYLAQPMGVSTNNNDKTRPSAPSLEYLLPATRVGVYIYQTLAVAEELDRTKSDKAIERLENLLLSPPSFIISTDPKVSRGDGYNLPPLVGEVAAAQQKQKERKQQSIDVGLTPQLFEVGELMGERLTNRRLVKAEKAMEGASQIRRALNIYTTNLNFNPNKYVYSGSKEEKSKLIREDKLPTAKDVIRSDLDARDLYRNALLTALDDAKAEFVYQQKNEFEDTSELVGLLKDAQVAIDKLFSFIDEKDVQAALSAVKKEQLS